MFKIFKRNLEMGILGPIQIMKKSLIRVYKKKSMLLIG